MEHQTPALSRFTFTEYLMGGDARLVVYAKDRPTAENACSAAFERIAELDSIMSDYRANSELMKLCGHAGGPAVAVSPDLFKILQKSLAMSRQSDGMFDITVGPVVKLWRKARKTHVLPTSGEIARARKLVGWRHVHLDPPTRSVRLDLARMKLDLGAIGKGYADDAAQAVLKAHGIHRALIEMGGDMVVSDPPLGTSGWRIETPNAGSKRVLTLANCGVSSSGDTEQHVVVGGVTYSHVVDPRTGMALTKRVQATVIGPNGTDCDAISTAVTLLSPAKQKRLLKLHPGVRAYVRVLR